MKKNGTSGGLHLSKLSISGFRGIRELEIKRLGRVTLLAGKNGAGKTAVLEAVRIFAARGCMRSVWMDVFRGHGDGGDDPGKDGPQTIDLNSVFHGRGLPDEPVILIGAPPKRNQLEIRFHRKRSDGIPVPGSDARWPFVANYGGRKFPIPIPFSELDERLAWRIEREAEDHADGPSSMKCLALGPGALRNEQVARLWDEVALTEAEEQAVEALKLVCEAGPERVAVVDARAGQRRVVVKFKSGDRPVPLRSLGDGAERVFGLALALAGSRGGFLVIDEVENGIHHSVQGELWRLLLNLAKRNNVQVIATTHGWDCVEKFAEAALEDEDVEGRLVRLEREEDGALRAVEYSEEALISATRHHFEMR